MGATRGLARIEPPRGTFILYSAGAGQSALDRLSAADTDGSSVFTRVLLGVLREPNRSLVDIAKETQLRVRDLAAANGYDQVPAYYDEIVGNFVLSAAASSSVGDPGPTPREGDEAVPSQPSIVAKVPGEGPTAVVSAAPPGQGEPPVRSTHGDWQVRCDTPTGAQSEQCVLMQFVTAEDRENVGLTVIVLKTADKKAKIMRILAPLGVLLPSGLGLKIDETDMGRAGFVRCLPNGCIAEVVLEDKLLSKLEGGKTATFTVFQTPKEGIGIPISLKGFADGMAQLL